MIYWIQKSCGTKTGHDAGQEAAPVGAWDRSEVLQTAIDCGWEHQKETDPGRQPPQSGDT